MDRIRATEWQGAGGTGGGDAAGPPSDSGVVASRPGDMARALGGARGLSPPSGDRPGRARGPHICGTAQTHAPAGGGRADWVSVPFSLTALKDYRRHGREIGAVWRELAVRDYPAMAAVGVHRLWDPTALVEVQGVAALTTR